VGRGRLWCIGTGCAGPLIAVCGLQVTWPSSRARPWRLAFVPWMIVWLCSWSGPLCLGVGQRGHLPSLVALMLWRSCCYCDQTVTTCDCHPVALLSAWKPLLGKTFSMVEILTMLTVVGWLVNHLVGRLLQGRSRPDAIAGKMPTASDATGAGPAICAAPERFLAWTGVFWRSPRWERCRFSGPARARGCPRVSHCRPGASLFYALLRAL